MEDVWVDKTLLEKRIALVEHRLVQITFMSSLSNCNIFILETFLFIFKHFFGNIFISFIFRHVRVRNLKFATYLKFATCGITNKLNELR